MFTLGLELVHALVDRITLWPQILRLATPLTTAPSTTEAVIRTAITLDLERAAARAILGIPQMVYRAFLSMSVRQIMEAAFRFVSM